MIGCLGVFVCGCVVGSAVAFLVLALCTTAGRSDRADEFEIVVRRIAEWDCLNPPNAELLGDLPWLASLVKGALGKEVGEWTSIGAYLGELKAENARLKQQMELGKLRLGDSMMTQNAVSTATPWPSRSAPSCWTATRIVIYRLMRALRGGGLMDITIGRIVIYRLTEQDADEINRRRVRDGVYHEQWPAGAQAHVGTEAMAGADYPMVVTHVTNRVPARASGQVLLDGNDVLWVRDRPEYIAPQGRNIQAPKPGEIVGRWRFPPLV
jgi:hypothetical protein